MKGYTKKSLALVLSSLVLLIALVGGTWSTAFGAGVLPAPSAAGSTFIIPTFDIVSVVTDSTVTIKTHNFPANDTFNVLMNTIGTRGIGGTSAGTINSGSGGSFTATFNIPAGLKGLQRIAIRLESPTSGFFSFNWFWNNTSSGIPVTGPTAVPFVIPTFTITAVSANNTVTIKTANFPANDTFNVTMGAFGTRGIGGTSAGTFSSGTGGTQTATFTIPSNLHGLQRIAIRLQSPTSGFFSYNWFWNTTTP